MIARRLSDIVDRALDGAYERLGGSYSYACWAFGVLVVAPGFLVVTVLLALPHVPELHDQLQLIVGLLAGVMVVATGAAWLRSGRGPARCLHRWWRAGRPNEGAEEVWRYFTDVSRALTTTMVYTGLLILVPCVIGIGAELELGGTGMLALIVVGTLLCVWISTAIFFLSEALIRPVQLDAARRLPMGFNPAQRALPFAQKVFGALLGVGLFASGLGVVLGSGNDPIDELLGPVLIVTGTALVIVLALTLVIVRSLLTPIDDLIAVTKRVGAGDLDASAPVASDDELGTLASSFNDMVGGLRRFTAENERLLDEVRASRARIVAASDAERRRVERNIHDGAQQRLVALSLQLRMLEDRADVTPELRGEIERVETNLGDALEELRELAAGLHPSVLSTDGLTPALEQLASNATVPVEIHAVDERFPDAIESTAYFVASEALANIGKYAQASAAAISVERRNGQVIVEIADDGVGGASIGAGSGLTGLADRVAALDGTLSIESAAGEGTTLRAELPLGTT